MSIIVTGGASGLGESIVIELLEKGEKVIFTFCKSENRAKQLCEKYKNATSFFCDFTSPDSVNIFCNSIANFSPKALVNNAFSNLEKKHFDATDITIFENNFHHNIVPVIKITQSSLAQFKAQKTGKIITILSSAIKQPPIGWSEYCAEKNYLKSLMQSISLEYPQYGITCNCISPSFMPTALNSEIDERVIEMMIKKHPLKQLLSEKEVAKTVVYLLLEASNHVNGQNLFIGY
jgi:NAD(P)-dependent dehydrogenase (short-subunit alcohol dehydrogenase family)